MDSHFPSWIFHHRDLLDILDNAEVLGKSVLAQRINHLHFTEGHLFALLGNSKYKNSILTKIFPGPCMNGKIECSWSDENSLGFSFRDYDIRYLLIDDGHSLILIPGNWQEAGKNGFVFQMTEGGFLVGQRQTKRYVCENKVILELVQSGLLTRGRLLDFSPMGFRARINPESSHFFKWINCDEPVTIQLRNGEEIFLSTTCRCIRKCGGIGDLEVVLVPTEKMIKRYEKRRIRNPRPSLVPSPVLTFFHPLLNKDVRLTVSDISTSGFSVRERHSDSVLLQGMIIRDLKVGFSAGLCLKCSAQVLYRKEEKENYIRWGIAILDMDVNAYSQLSHIVSSAVDPHSCVSQDVDLEALWEFLFESGFIYPLKYKLIQSHRDDFKKTYKKLYQEGPDIAKHITYQRQGRIEGHISMVRAYDRAWMIHHHAARKSHNTMAGLKVLKALMSFLSDMHRLPSAHMDYAFCYYRPESRFPDRIFGAFAREMQNPMACSLNLFTYHHSTTLDRSIHRPKGWVLTEFSSRDLWELSQFYDCHSGGLFLDILGLRSSEMTVGKLESVYRRHSLMRKWKLYSLRHEKKLAAVFIVDQSDLGLNLSELLNSIKVIVIETKDLPWAAVSFALGELLSVYDTDEVPALIHPHTYADSKCIPYEKQYYLWILNVQYGNAYLEFMAKKFGVNWS